MSESQSFSRIKTDFDPIFESETSSFINSDFETSSKFVTNYDYFSNSFFESDSSLEIISNIFIDNSNEQSIFYMKSLSDYSDSNVIFDSKSYIDNEAYSNLDSISPSLNCLLYNSDTQNSKNEGVDKTLIIGIVCGIIAAVLIVVKNKKKQNGLKENKSKIQLVETKSNQVNSLNVDDEDVDLDFWI